MTGWSREAQIKGQLHNTVQLHVMRLRGRVRKSPKVSAGSPTWKLERVSYAHFMQEHLSCDRSRGCTIPFLCRYPSYPVTPVRSFPLLVMPRLADVACTVLVATTVSPSTRS